MQSLTPENIEEGNKYKELARLIERHTGIDGVHKTALSSLDLFRSSDTSQVTSAIYEPSLCIIAQGRKQVLLGDSTYIYSPGHYLLVSVDVPTTGHVIDATPTQPYLALQLRFSPAQIGEVMSQAQFPSPRTQGINSPSSPTKQASAIAVSPLAPALLDSVTRLLQLLETPHDLPVLYPLLAHEILYRLLMGEQGEQLRQIAVSNSQTHRIALAIDWLKRNYTHSFRIEDIARIAHMSPSGFHHHFKEVTALTPLQYQKQLRLQEARRLLLSEDIDAATASHRVGYESPSQFSREYSRLFGAPPLRDITHLRGTLAAAV